MYYQVIFFGWSHNGTTGIQHLLGSKTFIVKYPKLDQIQWIPKPLNWDYNSTQESSSNKPTLKRFLNAEGDSLCYQPHQKNPRHNSTHFCLIHDYLCQLFNSFFSSITSPQQNRCACQKALFMSSLPIQHQRHGSL